MSTFAYKSPGRDTFKSKLYKTDNQLWQNMLNNTHPYNNRRWHCPVADASGVAAIPI